MKISWISAHDGCMNDVLIDLQFPKVLVVYRTLGKIITVKPRNQ
jgi:hypothetical protein